jgi:hypothetical protein
MARIEAGLRESRWPSGRKGEDATTYSTQPFSPFTNMNEIITGDLQLAAA